MKLLVELKMELRERRVSRQMPVRMKLLRLRTSRSAWL
jgi:hypothetical protein